MILSPAQLVPIDRRIVEEQMIALDPPFVAPSWAYAIFAYSFVPNCFAMAADGTVAPWRLADEIDWSTAVAVRFETPWGDRIDPLDAEENDLDWGDYE